jgi:hypothetical protein
MTTIAKGRDLVTLINVFTVEPDTQQEVVDLLYRSAGETRRVDGVS